jgi:hypothetical protein
MVGSNGHVLQLTMLQITWKLHNEVVEKQFFLFIYLFLVDSRAFKAPPVFVRVCDREKDKLKGR